jgi:hypothetical protein
MSFSYPDKVKIATVTIDENYNTEVKGEYIEYPAYVEQEDKLWFNNNGISTDPKVKIFVNSDTVIEKGYYIKITELKGMTITTSNMMGKERKITKAEPVGVFNVSHYEVEADSGN